MEKLLVKGTWYTVTTGSTCDVVDAEGRPLGTAEAGKQLTFKASTERITFSDDAAEVQAENFKGAPVKRWLLGRGVNALPQGYLAAEFLEFGAKDKYVEVTTPWTPAGAVVQVDAHERFYRLDVGSDEIGNGSHANYFFWGVKNKKWNIGCGTYGITTYSADTEWHDMKMIYAEDGGAWVDGLKVRACAYSATAHILKSFTLGRTTPTLNNLTYIAYTQVKTASLRVNGQLWRDVRAAIDPEGKPCMYDRIAKETFYNGTETALTVGMTLSQARNLGKLPAGGGTLTVSLPWDAQLDKKVDAALQTAKSNGWTIVVQYQEPDTTSAVYNKYAACKTRDDVLAVNADYLNDLTADGEWVYPMPEMTSFNNVGDYWTGFFYGSPIKKIKAVFPKCTYAHAMLGAVRTVEEVDLEFPIAKRVSAICRYSDNYKKVRIIAPEATVFSYNTMGGARKFVDCEYYAPKATDLTNLCHEALVLEEVKGEFGANAVTLTSAFSCCFKLKTFPTNYPKASTAANMFNKCEIPGEAAIAVLNSLPAYTSGSHPITMGIHADYEKDPDVLAALDNAEAKGWTVARQWNGTATAQTASTWGLRRRPIYAKVLETDLPDGTTERVLDWGHYVTNWEENGYQEFASEEEAKEYFNIGD